MERITGQVSKISSTQDGSVRLQIDVKYEDAQNIMAWLYQNVKIELVEVQHEKDN